MQFPKWQWTLLESVLVAHFFAGKYGIMVSNERQRSSAPAGRSQKRKGEASLGSLSLWSLFCNLYRHRLFRCLLFLCSLLRCPPFGHGFAVGQHQLDAVLLVDLGGAGVIVDGYDVGVGVVVLQAAHHALAHDVVGQAAEGLGADDVGGASSHPSPILHPSPR